MLRALSLVLAVAVGTGLSTAPATAKFTPKEMQQIAEIMKPRPKSLLAKTSEIVTLSAPILSAIAGLCYAWEPCDDTAASVAKSFHFKYPSDRHREHDHE